MSSNAPVCWENSRCEQRMNKVVVMTSDSLLRLEDSRREEERSRLSCGALTPGQSRRTDGQNTDLLPCAETTEDTSHIKYRRYGARLGGVKVRHKRQALQDMARPLKHWLYKHRDNPYPTKTEKVLLALGSHMTLVQVSNWFANARRRLKNTVRQPDLSWALRIKLYNKYIQGNAERLSVCSDDTNSEDEDLALQTPASRSDLSRSSFQKDVAQKQVNVLTRTDSANSDDSVSPPSKYKSSLLNRYLNDTLHHVMAPSSDGVPKPGRRRRRRRRRSHSESFSSIEYDEEATSPACSSEMETNFVYHMDTFDYASTKCNTDQDWREIHAAMALTNLAQGQQGAAGQSCRREPTRVIGQSCRREPTRVTGQSCTREPISVTGQICTSGPTGAARTTLLGRTCATGSSMWQSCAVGSTLTSCIIQKSSHISEIKTVKLALENSL